MKRNKKLDRSAPPDWNHWWRSSPFFSLDNGGTEDCRPGAEFWYEHYWRHRALSAWAYELVRRVVKLPGQQKLIISQSDRELVQNMPPYSRLSQPQKRILHVIFNNEFHREEALDKGPPGLEEPWKQGQPQKLGDWRQVEVFDNPFDPEDKDRRDAGKDYMKRFLPLIIGAWELMQAPGREPLELLNRDMLPQHELSGWDFTWDEFEKALRDAFAQRAARLERGS